ncbi:LysR family transcriptional regulator [Enterococcus malodoratus]|uniref:LysR family transcriptional regulator n=1 Tax=Enterococcus malodoratus TaxID=71451 RepID=UPI0039AF3B24
MNLRQLEYFVSLAETEHMTRTASELGTTQSNISHALKSLEDELGVSLFEKKGRNILLTQYGKQFYRYVVPSLRQLDQGRQSLQELANLTPKVVRLGFVHSVGPKFIPKALRSFLALPNQSAVHFDLIQGNTVQLIERLKEQSLDLAVCSRLTNTPEIEFRKLVKEELVAVVANNHSLAEEKEISLARILDYPLVHYTKSSGLRQYLDDIFLDLRIYPEVAYELAEDNTILGFVEQDLGIALVPKIVPLDSYNVKALPIVDNLPERNLYLATKRNFVSASIIEEFSQFLIRDHQN